MQYPNSSHEGPLSLEKDTRHPWVFVARRFWYLGRNATQIPVQFKSMFGGRGTRVNHPTELVATFRDWVQASLTEGVNALPRDLECDAGREPEAASSGGARGISLPQSGVGSCGHRVHCS